MVVPAGKLQSVLGVTKVKVVRGHSHLAVVDSTLAEDCLMRAWIVAIAVVASVVGLGYVHPFGNPRVEPAKGGGTLLQWCDYACGCEGGVGGQVRGLPLERDAMAGVCEGCAGVVADRAGHR